MVNECSDVQLGRVPSALEDGCLVAVLDYAYLNEIDLVERVVASWLLDIKNGDYIFVVEVSEELHLAESSEAKHGVVEWRNLFDGYFLARRFVDGGAGSNGLVSSDSS